jgi:hypothetical protein
LITTIKEMQQKQEANLIEIQFKLIQMSKMKIKDNLEVTNKFRPNVSLFDQGTSLFGSIKLEGYHIKLRGGLLK